MNPQADLAPRLRVEAALRGGHADRVPFTMYESKIPQCTAEREMRNRGLCIVKRDVPVFRTHHPNVRTESHHYVPHYNEAAEVMHRHGKLIGCHFDDNCRLLADAIASTDLDYVEAFTPAPDTDMTLAEARKAWPDKVIWLNFPSSQHLKSDDQVRQITLDLLDQGGTADGLLVGVTEDVPEDRWQSSCRAILDGLEEHARLHPERYA